MSEPEKKWLSPPDDDLPSTRAFLEQAFSRIHPGSDATEAERAWLGGIVLGISLRLCAELAKESTNG